MPKRIIDVRQSRPWLDLVSHPRGGPGQQIHLSRAQIEQIARTVRRHPEVVIKVLPKDSNNAGAIQKHIDYIGRKGELELETDDGTHLQGKDAGKQLIDDWDLDLESQGRESEFSGARGRRASKLVHKLVFSMPPGTPPKGVLAAVRNFALEKFALQHRYAMVLHTDEPHPHIHVVVKAVSEQGIRLNINKETLREWRSRFAHYLREQGIAANATDRFVRGETEPRKRDGIYRAAQRGESTHMRYRVETVAHELLRGNLQIESGQARLVKTYNTVKHGWEMVRQALHRSGQSDFAKEVDRFAAGLPPPRTEKQRIAAELLNRDRTLHLAAEPMVR